LIFRIRTQRFVFQALDRVYFPAGRAGNILRGTFGKLLWGAPGFADLFAPTLKRGPSGLADPPRPFVFRAAHLDGCTFEPGQSFFFDVHIFGLHAPVTEAFIQAFSQPEITNFRLPGFRLIRDPAPPVTHSIDLAGGPVTRSVTVTFRTPVDLKGNPSPNDIPFGVLFARVRDRIGTLSSLYGDGPLQIDYKGMAARADLVQTAKSDIRYQEISRRSARTGHVHPIGGFTGVTEYQGDLTEFMPYLRAAWWTGVGRHTVWGNGVIECVI
jgi:hypothetical protein